MVQVAIVISISSITVCHKYSETLELVQKAIAVISHLSFQPIRKALNQPHPFTPIFKVILKFN